MPVTFKSRVPTPVRIRGMAGSFCLGIALLAHAPLGARAETSGDDTAGQTATAPSRTDTARAGRYTMVPAEGGFVRLDTETGSVSHCRRGDAAAGSVWQCAPIPEDVIAKPEAEEPGDEVAALRREVADLRARLDTVERRAVVSAPAARGSGDPEMDRAMNFSEELMRRFFGLVREFKQDVDQDRI